MSTFNQLLDRNRKFAGGFNGGQPLMPKFNTIVLSCIDARVDPAHYLGLENGDSLVMRNAGARLTHELSLEIAILWRMAKKVAGDRFPGFELAIVHHTDCGFERVANPEIAAAIGNSLSMDPADIVEMSISDHAADMQADLERFAASNLVPHDMIVSAHIYDVQTGLVETSIPATTLGHFAN